ncbi:hypothetical protein CDL15_Pgr022456 [Punica granatum]|nr:hypothetical protein CDL15_Pgr022456 [Punica granatum]
MKMKRKTVTTGSHGSRGLTTGIQLVGGKGRPSDPKHQTNARSKAPILQRCAPEELITLAERKGTGRK